MRTYAFIDASNLFYGGEKSLGWKIDYEKLLHYLREKADTLNDAQVVLTGRHLQRARFYRKLSRFGYTLYLKPVKSYEQEDGGMRRKANCDVEMTFRLMKEQDNFDRIIILSGDGDFLPVLKYLKSNQKEVIVLARGPRTAREIRQFAGSNFRDFEYLRELLKMRVE